MSPTSNNKTGGADNFPCSSMNLRCRAIFPILPRALLYEAVPKVQPAKMPALDNHYEIWGPASRLRPVLPPGTLDTAKKIQVCTHTKSPSPSCKIHCLDCESHLVQDTGSNMLAEDDLATLFGRYVIETSVGNAFRTVVNTLGAQSQHSKDIYLRVGRGPTLERALAGNGSFMFATVVQCAFLCSVRLHYPREIRKFWAFHWTLLSSSYPLTTRGEHCAFVNLDFFWRLRTYSTSCTRFSFSRPSANPGL